MAKTSWNGRRTLDHCGLITRCIKAGIGKPDQHNEKCAGYQKSENDDEPCSVCMECRLQESYVENHESDCMTDYQRDCIRTGY